MKVVYARTGKTWAVAPDGTRVWVHIGQHWPADDPVVKKYPGLFTDDPAVGLSFSVTPRPDAPPTVEQATAAPGERRAVRRPRRAEPDEGQQQ